jgi:hypothetical protein
VETIFSEVLAFSGNYFQGADLRDVKWPKNGISGNFKKANLENVDFQEHTILNADLREANLKNANFKKAIFMYPSPTNAIIYLARANFIDAKNINYENFIEAKGVEYIIFSKTKEEDEKIKREIAKKSNLTLDEEVLKKFYTLFQEENLVKRKLKYSGVDSRGGYVIRNDEE